MLHDDPRDVQPAIENDQQLAGYRLGLEQMNSIVAGREETLFASRGDPHALEAARHSLYRVYRRRQGILDAIEIYERQQTERQGLQQNTQTA